MTALAVAVVLAIPVAMLIALLRLANVVHARREQVVARQIALTDAIHGVLGPVVAPVVRRGRRGWIAVLPVASGQPHIDIMIELAQAELGPTAQIVLVAPEPYPTRARRVPAPALAA